MTTQQQTFTFKYGHQGDVSAIRLPDDHPDTAKFIALAESGKLPLLGDRVSNRVTLIEGEATHHHHELRYKKPDDMKAYRLPTIGKAKVPAFLVIVKNKVPLEHYHTQKKILTKEHGTEKFPAGAYIFGGQQLMSHEKELMRQQD